MRLFTHARTAIPIPDTPPDKPRYGPLDAPGKTPERNITVRPALPEGPGNTTQNENTAMTVKGQKSYG